MNWFLLFWSFLIIQRLAEVRIAKSNEKKLLSKGAVEAGSDHYKWMVSMHVAFFVVFFLEVYVFNAQPPSWWIVPFTLFLMAQVIRVWAISSLGEFWNTKIILLPGANVVARGPYRFMRHPNYTVVSLELLVMPLIFGAYFTAILFTILNIFMLRVRIPAEEKALMELTDYEKSHGQKQRFFPSQ
ncbi:isoprenylcysteine carboxyl methyltransferase family protein [Fictibacillus norfolkensis]|jgi:methyltransferase|uniref:Isoprenylcysteine carboxyl methyltransferase n=1 Tax=Fictibacillus norfolkensis TaxID=2762233 RepID=A0ABR8SMR1_9BACL|nr:isoprenylcysteine carboxylmethyltransferase family protein [Fictibacillus norfolkensis]MBD7964654.1 isoprenylcysteine carboxyl methyltransferase [Fictibacillus norfolkensis]